MWLFKCKHPANSLIPKKEQTVEQEDRDYEIVTYHFVCTRCESPVQLKHARFIGGVEGFLNRHNKGVAIVC